MRCNMKSVHILLDSIFLQDAQEYYGYGYNIEKVIPGRKL